MSDVRARFIDAPHPPSLIDWLCEGPGGAVHMVVTRANPPGLTATPKIDASRLEERARSVSGNSGVHRVLLIHTRGKTLEGEPVAIAGATADHRAEAFEAVDLLLGLLTGVAERQDLRA